MGESRQRYAVITTHDREKDFWDCVTAISPQVDAVVVVSHRADYVTNFDKIVAVIEHDQEVPNISVMWNAGLGMARALAGDDPYDVAVLNDDTIVPVDWFRRVTTAMRAEGAAAGCVRRRFDPRMAGYAFILDGGRALYADPQFQWWYGDDDLQRRAEAVGGVAFADGPDVEHRYPNSTTVGVLADVASGDALRYKEKWG